MPPKPPGKESAKSEFRPGLITCTAAAFSDDSRLAFVVHARIALVLDRKSLDDGQIIGMLCDSDIVCASLVELPWVMLPEGSCVRHPKMREGHIKLQRDGWMITRHPTFGDLMSPVVAERVRRYFEEDAFSKLPLVRAKAKAKAKAKAQAQAAEPHPLEDGEVAARDGEAMLPSLRDTEAASRREDATSRAGAAAAPRAEAAASSTVEGVGAGTETARESASSTTGLASALENAPEPEGRAVASGLGAGKAAARSVKAEVARIRDKAGTAGMAEVAPPLTKPAPFPPLAHLAGGLSQARTTPSVAKATTKKAVAAKKGPGVAQVATVERTKAPPETLDSHLRTCACEHWKVVHDFVFLRSVPSVAGEQLGVLRRGAVFCLAAASAAPSAACSPLETRSADGKWVKCGKEAMLWPKIETTEPEFLFRGEPKRQAGYVLIKNEEHGDLLRLVPNTKPDVVPLTAAFKDSQRHDAQHKDNGKLLPPPDPEPKAEPLTLEAVAKLEHWIVESDSAKVFAARDEESAVELSLNVGDLITVGGASWTRTWGDAGGKQWLLLPPGGQIYRKLEARFPASGYKKNSYILIGDGEAVLVKEHKPPETGVTVRLLSGYGEPWAVEHDQVVVRRGPSTSDVPVGIMLKGDVVGVRRKEGDWVELVEDSDVRFRKKGTSGVEANSTFLSSVNPFRETRVDEATMKKRREAGGFEPLAVPSLPRGDVSAQAWMLVDHPSLGQLLRRARKRRGGLASGVVISKARFGLYREVVELCHRRIYEENLEGLWDGERDKLPTQESIEAKLFESNASVVHVTSAGKFCGGAIIKHIAVKARQVEGSSNLNLTGIATPEDNERSGRTTVGYIDSCAAEPGTGGGRLIWDSLAAMDYVCLTCHSILLQKTVDFWQACGMRRLDPSKEGDCEEFKKNILVHTMGKVICELSDVERELPGSKLPLFVWVPSRFSHVAVDPHSDYIFTPDDRDGYFL